IVVEAEGGKAPYRYDFENAGNFDFNNHFKDLAAGDYVIAIRDDDDCLGFQIVSLDQPDSLSVDVEYHHILCFGEENGEAEVKVTGGTPEYEFLWDSGETESRIRGKRAGPYQVQIKDGHECIREVLVLLEQPPELELLLEEKRDLICFGDRDGFISLASAGGTGTHQYSFQQEEFSFKPRYNDLPAGQYTAIVSDENQCEITLEVELIQPEQIIVQIEGIGENPGSAIKLGEKINLEGHFTPSDRVMEWEWEPEEIFDCPSCQSTEVQPVRNTG